MAVFLLFCSGNGEDGDRAEIFEDPFGRSALRRATSEREQRET